MAERKVFFAAADGSHEVKTKSGKWYLITERRTEEGGTVTIYTDITRQKLAEQQRELSENRLAQAQKLARLGIFDWDVDRREMFWSETMYDIVGLPPDTPPPESRPVRPPRSPVQPRHRQVDVAKTFGQRGTIQPGIRDHPARWQIPQCTG
jgi:PAS domain-containing protein